MASEHSSKGGSINAAKIRAKVGSRGSNASAAKTKNFDRVLSSRAINIGTELGITADFITQQTAE